MPCYDPPLPWEGRAKASAIEAAKLLCASVGTLIDQNLIDPKLPGDLALLLWYREHRAVDFERADYMQEPLGFIREDLARVDALIRKAAA